MQNLELRDYVALISAIIAVLAFVRPEISRFIRRLRTRIDVHLADRVEIGFSNAGPLVNLNGTLFSAHSSHMIRSMSLCVTREHDHSKHTFSWALFRDADIVLNQGAEQAKVRIATAFSLKEQVAQRFYIVFQDVTTKDAYSDTLSRLQSLWADWLQNKSEQGLTVDTNTAFQHFNEENKEILTSCYTTIDRILYWTPGSYKIMLTLETVRPAKTFFYEFIFSISVAESDLLRRNTFLCLLAVTSTPQIQFNFVYPRVREEARP